MFLVSLTYPSEMTVNTDFTDILEVSRINFEPGLLSGKSCLGMRTELSQKVVTV